LRIRIGVVLQEPLSHGVIAFSAGKVQGSLVIDHTVNICTKLQKRREYLQTCLTVRILLLRAREGKGKQLEDR
jgi:hypothetical protein